MQSSILNKYQDNRGEGNSHNSSFIRCIRNFPLLITLKTCNWLPQWIRPTIRSTMPLNTLSSSWPPASWLLFDYSWLLFDHWTEIRESRRWSTRNACAKWMNRAPRFQSHNGIIASFFAVSIIGMAKTGKYICLFDSIDGAFVLQLHHSSSMGEQHKDVMSI